VAVGEWRGGGGWGGWDIPGKACVSTLADTAAWRDLVSWQFWGLVGTHSCSGGATLRGPIWSWLFYLFIWGNGVWTHSLKIASQVLYHLLEWCSQTYLSLLWYWSLKGFKLQALYLLGRCCTTWVTPPVPPLPVRFAVVYFSGRVFIFCHGPPALGCNPTYAFCVAGITDVLHHTQLVCWDGILKLFAQTELEPQSSGSLPPKWLNYRSELLFQLFAVVFGFFRRQSLTL
jgi:hypothetical protein